MKILYGCEKCDYVSEKAQETYEHEMKVHHCLTLEDAAEWLNLKAKAKSAALRAGYSQSKQSELEFDEAYNELLEFEKQHYLIKEE